LQNSINITIPDEETIPERFWNEEFRRLYFHTFLNVPVLAAAKIPGFQKSFIWT